MPRVGRTSLRLPPTRLSGEHAQLALMERFVMVVRHRGGVLGIGQPAGGWLSFAGMMTTVMHRFNSGSSCMTAVCSTSYRIDQPTGVACSTGLDVRRVLT